jgi:glycosyltransferase involved in cell wall biosynthesis
LNGKRSALSLLIVCFESAGGLADYAHSQAEALAQLGIKVTLLAPADFLHQSSQYRLAADLPSSEAIQSLRLLQRVCFVARLLASVRVSESAIRAGGYRLVLFTSYTEYLAPLWAWRFRRLRQRAVHFAAVVHDPVRSYQVGPRWWHRWSIAEGYSFLEQAFVHAPIALDTARPMPDLRVTVIPHGPFPFPHASLSRAEARRLLGVPLSVPLLLCFGRLRNDKNLGRVLQALASQPNAHLLVVGPEATPGQLQSGDYQQLAQSLGVDSRCHWQIHFHSPQEVANMFAAADVAVVAYSASFRSASGVLNVVANYRLPVVASAGDSSLLSAVQLYRLGVAVSPDDTPALTTAIRSILANPPEPDWQGYTAANSWERNAELVAQAFGLEPEPQAMGR